MACTRLARGGGALLRGCRVRGILLLSGLAEAERAAWAARMGAAATSVALYSAASSTMILFNKASMRALPAPCMVSFLQVFATSLAIVFLWCAGAVRLHAVDRATLQRYALYSAVFVLGMNFSMRVLAATNVETLLVFRACAPILVAVIDAAVLGHAVPTPRTLASLLSIVLGAAWFLVSESHFSVRGLRGIALVSVNTGLTAVLMTYGKWITQGADVSLSMAVLLSNATSMVPILLLGFVEGELDTVLDFEFSPEAVGVLLMSCVVGTAISYTGWQCRILMSATSYTLVGVLNKILTMVVNLLVWEDHARWLSCLGLLICLLGGCFYQQAPPAAEEGSAPDEEAALKHGEEHGVLLSEPLARDLHDNDAQPEEGGGGKGGGAA